MTAKVSLPTSDEAGKRVLLFCLLFALGIQLCDLLFNFFQLIDSSSLRKIFNVAREESLGTWFSVVQAAITGLVALGIYQLSRLQGARKWGWLFLGLFFVYMSADDAAKIHERVGGYIGKLASSGEAEMLSSVTSLSPSYNWQLVFVPLYGLAALYILYFLARQLRGLRLKLMVIAAFACWTTAVGIDFIEGVDGFFESMAESLDVKKYTVSHPFLMLEEFLEMFGTTLFLSVFVQTLLTELSETTFQRTATSGEA